MIADITDPTITSVVRQLHCKNVVNLKCAANPTEGAIFLRPLWFWMDDWWM